MEEKIREYIRNLFVSAPKTDRVMGIERKVVRIAEDKYNSLVEKGSSEEEAYNAVVSDLGYVSDLIEEVQRGERMGDSIDEDFQNPSYFMSIGVAGYILSLVPVVMALVYNWSIGISLLSFLAVIAVSTGLFVYGWSMRQKSGAASGKSGMWGQWDRGSRVKLRLMLSFALWAVIVTIYLVASVLTDRWSITWLIFPLGVAIEAFLSIFFTMKRT